MKMFSGGAGGARRSRGGHSIRPATRIAEHVTTLDAPTENSDVRDSTFNPISRGAVMMIALIALVSAGRAVLYDTIDPDCFWHLRVADQLLQQGVGPITDDLSYASKPDPWTPYSWLAELGMRATWELGGFRAAIVVHALNSAAIVMLIALSCVEAARGRDDKEPRTELSIVLATAFATFFTLAYLSFRPASFAITLLALCIWILLRDMRAQKPTDSHRWALVFITLLLTNIHLYAFLVPVWIAALALGAVWEKRFDAARRYFRTAIACGAACWMTPMLPGVIRTILHYQFSDDMVSGPVIVEMQPFYTGVAGAIMLVLLMVFALCALRNRKNLSAGIWLWIILGAALLFQLGRFAPLFALVAAPAMTLTMPRWSDRVLYRPALPATIGTLLLIGLIRMTLAFPVVQSFDAWVNRHGPDAPGYPCSAARYVEQNVTPVSGRIINEFTWGGYLAWRLEGRFQVFMDGRTQVYPAEFWRATYFGSEDQRRQILLQAGADAAILPVQKGIFQQHLREMGWSTAFCDEISLVMLPPGRTVAKIE